MTALSIVVFRLTGTGTSLGINVACQFLPMLLLGAWAGAFADRHNKRHITLITQSVMTIQAVLIGVLELAGQLTLPLVYGLSLALGLAGAMDNPARRGLVIELVEPASMSNAMALNTAVMTGSRIVGPALAALLIDLVGAGWCFVANAMSFVAVLVSLATMDTTALRVSPPAVRGGTPVRDGLRFVFSDPRLRILFISLTVVSTFQFNYSVSLPVLTARAFGDGKAFGWLLGVSSIGSFIGSLLVAGRERVTMRWFFGATAVMGVASLAVAFAPNLATAFVMSIPMGIGGAAFIASSSALLQEMCPPDMRSRLLALTAVAFLGSTPIGGPITGWIADHVGPRWSLGYGGFVTLGVVAIGAARLPRHY